MSVLTTLPLLGLAAFVAFALTVARGATVRTWLFPAGLAVAFGVFSVVVVAAEGPLGFWTVHSQTLWGNQVWLDLLLALGIGWAFLVPRARALGMRPLPWLLAVLLSGGIGLLAMAARVLYLQERAPRVPHAAS